MRPIQKSLFFKSYSRSVIRRMRKRIVQSSASLEIHKPGMKISLKRFVRIEVIVAALKMSLYFFYLNLQIFQLSLQLTSPILNVLHILIALIPLNAFSRFIILYSDTNNFHSQRNIYFLYFISYFQKKIKEYFILLLKNHDFFNIPFVQSFKNLNFLNMIFETSNFHRPIHSFSKL